MVLLGQVGPLAQVGAAEHDGAAKVEARRVAQHVHADAGGARLVAHERDVGAVAVERLDVLVDVLERQSLIVQAEVARRALALRAQEAERSEAIVDRDHDEAALRQHEAVEELRRAAAEAAAVYVHDDRVARRRKLVRTLC